MNKPDGLKFDFKITEGAECAFSWPCIQNILSVSSKEELLQSLSNNPTVSVTEKLDGSNICISSHNWVASRKVYICEDIRTEDLQRKKFRNLPISSLKGVVTKLRKIADDIKPEPELRTEALLYGEWLYYGTSRTQNDRFKYVKRGYKVAHVYAFGLGIRFDEELQGGAKTEFENFLTEKTGWGPALASKTPNFYLITFNGKLNDFLESYGLETVAYLGDFSLKDALLHPTLALHFQNRSVEGFILSCDKFIFKWKFNESGDKNSQEKALTELRALTSEPDTLKVLQALQDTCLSDIEASKPKEKPKKHLYLEVLRSATSKYPSLLDALDEGDPSTQETWTEICNNYKKFLYKEAKEDFIERGFNITDELEKNIKASVTGFVTSLFNRWFYQKKKNEVEIGQAWE